LSREQFDEDEGQEHVEEGTLQVDDEADTVTADQTNGDGKDVDIGDGPGAFDIDTDI
jgi:hypothetical protein